MRLLRRSARRLIQCASLCRVSIHLDRQRLAWPVDADDRAGGRRDAVFKGQIGPGALQKRLRDEEAKTEAAFRLKVRILSLAAREVT